MGPFLGALVSSVIIAIIFAVLFEKEPKRDSIIWSMLLVFLPLWAIALWATPIGPLYWGVAWVDMLIIGVFLMFIIAAASPAFYGSRSNILNQSLEDKPKRGASNFFWTLVAIAILFIIAGYSFRYPQLAH